MGAEDASYQSVSRLALKRNLHNKPTHAMNFVYSLPNSVSDQITSRGHLRPTRLENGRGCNNQVIL
jgi:hypothetical protein